MRLFLGILDKANLGGKGAKRSVKVLAVKFYKNSFKDILLLAYCGQFIWNRIVS